MILLKEAEKVSKLLTNAKRKNAKVSFVPTMGALHQGHLSLLSEAKNLGDVTVCSIFVNPTQFTNAADFEKYPSTLEQDIDKLTAAGCDVLFLPSVVEIYPAGYRAPLFDLGYIETILEGFYRPGHFQGVCQVVDRLLQIVNPDSLLLGQKDFQQCKVIERLLTLTDRTTIQLYIAPTVREKDGLAMSSRNLRLDSVQRSKAVALYTTLQKAQHEISTKTAEEICNEAVAYLESNGFAVDYFNIVDADTLLPPQQSDARLVAVVAAYLNDIRLIDNLLIQ